MAKPPAKRAPVKRAKKKSRLRVPVSARSQDAVDACSLAVVIWLTRDRARYTETDPS
jgi:hypothetical protein